MEVKKDTRIRQGSNSVAGYELSYNINQLTNEPVSNVNCSVLNASSNQIGNLNAYSTGKIFISLEDGITCDEAKKIINVALDDFKSIFEENKEA